METLVAFFGLFGTLIFAVSILMFILNKLRKKETKKFKLGSIVGIGMFVVAMVLAPGPSEEPASSVPEVVEEKPANDESQEAENVEKSKTDEEAKLKAEEEARLKAEADAKAKQEAEMKAAEEKTAVDKVLMEALNELETHYNLLESTYQSEKSSYDDLRWGKFSAQWNRDLTAIRDKYELNGGQPIGSAKFDLGFAAATMFTLWSEYNSDLDGRGQDKQLVKINKEDIESSFQKAKEKLKQ